MLVRVTYHFLSMCWRVHAIFLVLLLMILLGAAVIAIYENMPIGKAIYFSFITGLTIGYGDIVAHTTVGQIVSVVLGFVGVLFSGLVVAITIKAVQSAVDESRKSD